MSFVIDNSELEGYFIDCDDVLSGEVLEISSDESLREEEAGNPENIRCSVVDPLLKEGDPID